MEERSPKLVRDRIPDMIFAKGGTCRFHTADAGERAQLLCEKMAEEIVEFLLALDRGNRDHAEEELADVLEVASALAQLPNIDALALFARRRPHRRFGFFRRWRAPDETAEPRLAAEPFRVALVQGTLNEDFARLCRLLDVLMAKKRDEAGAPLLRATRIGLLKDRKRRERGGFERGIVLTAW